MSSSGGYTVLNRVTRNKEIRLRHFLRPLAARLRGCSKHTLRLWKPLDQRPQRCLPAPRLCLLLSSVLGVRGIIMQGYCTRHPQVTYPVVVDKQFIQRVPAFGRYSTGTCNCCNVHYVQPFTATPICLTSAADLSRRWGHTPPLVGYDREHHHRPHSRSW